MISKHYANNRTKREEMIKAIGEGEVVYTFIRERRNHSVARFEVTTNALVKVWATDVENFLITQYFARPQQLREIFQEVRVPRAIMNLAIEHKRTGINEI